MYRHLVAGLWVALQRVLFLPMLLAFSAANAVLRFGSEAYCDATAFYTTSITAMAATLLFTEAALLRQTSKPTSRKA